VERLDRKTLLSALGQRAVPNGEQMDDALCHVELVNDPIVANPQTISVHPGQPGVRKPAQVGTHSV
jgi:hypothetical protein